jgi:hypothetical protein
MVFYGIHAATVTMQWFGEHVSTTEDGVFCGVHAKEYLINGAMVQI